ncbi:two-component response regulator-like APRR1 [Impatiens glandulifera]|uniref:two-component response regulator-like APRR1 n=1 Tax=Impatiens glandulifera TaxID=253017 RepID=UPI001FB113B7|nr:two-component response regulator-like APRR1 [Impatiens glandulifera]
MDAPTVPSHDKIVVEEEGRESHSQPDDLPSSTGGSYPDSVSLERSPTPILQDYQQQQQEHHHHPRTNMHPCDIPGNGQVSQNNLSQVQMGMLQQQQQYNHHHMIPSSTFDPCDTCIQAQTTNWSFSFGHSSSSKTREAATIRFRQKRKERCFDKNIRYANRTLLGKNRITVNGQFDRMKGYVIGLDLKGQHSSVDIDEYEDDEEEYEDCAVMDSSPDKHTNE